MADGLFLSGGGGDHDDSASWSLGPSIRIPDPYTDPWERFQKTFQWTTSLVIGAIFIGFMTMLLMTAGLVIDAWNYRNTVMKDNRNFEVQSRLLEQNVLQQEQMLLQLKQINGNLFEHTNKTQ